MHVQTSAMPNAGCIIDGVIPNGAVRSRKSDITGKVTCSPAFIRNFTDDRSQCLSRVPANASAINLKPKFGAQL